MNILVVGGAGYIGSHCVRQLIREKHTPIVLDSLIYGHKNALSPDVKFYQGDLGDKKLVSQILKDEKIDIVMHFAAFINVGESVTNPLKYYENNLIKPINLIQTMIENNVLKFVFSSTCATYGEPLKLPLDETHSQLPINAYGQTKLDLENFLKICGKAYGLSSVALRYFNASGADFDGTIGEDHEPETHLIPLAIYAAMGIGKELKIFGDDYNTPDGTCLRDYVHVNDLSTAHILAFEKLKNRGEFNAYNLGTGTPNSVLEIINAVEEISGLKVPHSFAPRRDGDPAKLYANPEKAKSELGWQAKHTDVKDIIKSAWLWHSKNPKGFSE